MNKGDIWYLCRYRHKKLPLLHSRSRFSCLLLLMSVKYIFSYMQLNLMFPLIHSEMAAVMLPYNWTPDIQKHDATTVLLRLCRKEKTALRHCCCEWWSLQFTDDIFGALRALNLDCCKITLASHITAFEMNWNEKCTWQAVNWPGRPAQGLTWCNLCACENTIISCVCVARGENQILSLSATCVNIRIDAVQF